MLQRREQLGVHSSGKTSQLLGIQLVGLSPLAIDQPRLARVGHQDLVATLFEHPAHPRRVSSRLDGDCHLLLGVEAPLEGLGGGTQPTLFYDLASVCVDEAEIAVFVAEIQTGCHHRRCSSLLPSFMGRSPPSILSPYGARIRLQTHAAQGTARGIGLLIPSKVELEEGAFSEVRPTSRALLR